MATETSPAVAIEIDPMLWDPAYVTLRPHPILTPEAERYGTIARNERPHRFHASVCAFRRADWSKFPSSDFFEKHLWRLPPRDVLRALGHDPDVLYIRWREDGLDIPEDA